MPTFVGALVATAGFAKAYQSFADPLIETLQTSIYHWFQVGLIGSEIAFGVWLYCGFWQRQTRKMAIALFLVYLAVSLHYTIGGKASCGCFGNLPLHPWITAVMDAAVVCALFRWQPHGTCESGQDYRLGRLIVVGVASTILLGIVALTATLLRVKSAQIDEDGAINGQGVVLLEPQRWMGKRFPLLPYVTTEADLSKGTWVLVLVRPDCPKCQTVLPSYEEMAREWMERGLSARIAVIEVPTLHSSACPEADYPSKTVYIRGRLMEKKEWFVQTPVQIRIEEGMVVEATTL